MRVLIAEDDPLILTTFQRALERAGHEVAAVEDGATTAELAAARASVASAQARRSAARSASTFSPRPPEKRRATWRPGSTVTKRIVPASGAGRSGALAAGIMKRMVQVPSSTGVCATGTVIAIFSPRSLPPKM